MLTIPLVDAADFTAEDIDGIETAATDLSWAETNRMNLTFAYEDTYGDPMTINYVPGANPLRTELTAEDYPAFELTNIEVVEP